MDSMLPVLGHLCGLRPVDVYGDTTQPGLTLRQLDVYVQFVEDARRRAAGQEAAGG